MQTFLLLFSFIILSSSYALDLNVESQNGQINLISKNSELIYSELNSFKEYCNTEVKLNDKGLYTAQINHCLKQNYIRLNKTYANMDGPNCWNFALTEVGLNNYYRYTTPEEFQLVHKNFCQEITKEEAILSPNSIGRIVSKKGEEIHAFKVVSKSLIMAKHATQGIYPYKLMTFDEMLHQYGRIRKCRMKDDYSPNCYNEVFYYKCERAQVPTHLKKVFTNLKYIQKIISTLLISKEHKIRITRDITDINFKRFNSQIDRLHAIPDSTYKNISESIDESLYGKWIKYQTQALISDFYTIRRIFGLKRKADKTSINEAKRKIKLLKEIKN